MSDDDDTLEYKRRPRRHWNDEDRAQWSADLRRLEAEAAAAPTPVEPEAEITGPVALLERSNNEEERAWMSLTGRDPDSPVPFAQFAKVVDQLHRERQEVRREQHGRRKRDTEQERRHAQLEQVAHTLADQIVGLRHAVSPEHLDQLRDQIAEVKATQARAEADRVKSEADRKSTRKTAGGALLALLGSLGALFATCKKADEQRITDSVKLELMQKKMDEMSEDVRELRRDLSRRSLLTPQATGATSARKTAATMRFPVPALALTAILATAAPAAAQTPATPTPATFEAPADLPPAAPVVVAPVPAGPADELADPLTAPGDAFGDLIAAKRTGGWALALLAALVMLTRIVARLPGAIGAWFRGGTRAVVVPIVAVISVAAFDTLALGGTWVAVLFAAVGAGFALLAPIPPQKTQTASSGVV